MCIIHPAVPEENTVAIEPNRTQILGTGIVMNIPKGYHVEVRSRSGLAAKHDIHVLNSPGTIDSDYTGEVKVIIHNSSSIASMQVNKGDRIAQVLLRKNVKTKYVMFDKSKETKRSSGGFGSTGK
jgi:dUTP pyrophosphatase